MKRIGDRNFLYAWQTIRAAQEPGPETMGWTLDGAVCRRTRFSHASADFSVVHDIHHVARVAPDGWIFMVVSETWWDNRHHVIRSQHWATPIHGATTAIQDWVGKQAAKLRDRPVSPGAWPA